MSKKVLVWDDETDEAPEWIDIDELTEAFQGPETEPEEPEDDDDDDGDGDEYSADDIRKMKKKELLELIEDNDLETDPDDHDKLKDLREAVIEELELEEAEEEDEDEDEPEADDDDDWDDDDEEEEPKPKKKKKKKKK